MVVIKVVIIIINVYCLTRKGSKLTYKAIINLLTLLIIHKKNYFSLHRSRERNFFTITYPNAVI